MRCNHERHKERPEKVSRADARENTAPHRAEDRARSDRGPDRDRRQSLREGDSMERRRACADRRRESGRPHAVDGRNRPGARRLRRVGLEALAGHPQMVLGPGQGNRDRRGGAPPHR
ncbi:MAG: hypothetical protein [Microviridae sp.]|nr:MAG: hypothetical protein [Microviridae sp.]